MQKTLNMKSGFFLRPFIFLLLTPVIFTLPACKKDTGNPPKNILSSKTWKRGLTDKNPSTNPPGKIIYYAVKDCEKDDTFKFDPDGELTLNRNNSQCNPDEQKVALLTYALQEETKKLTIDGTDYILLEESKNQVKYGAALSSGTGNEYLVFLLQ